MGDARPHPRLPTHRILILGASYAGLSCLQNLLRLSNGETRHYGTEKLPSVSHKLSGSLEITLLDERDGFFHTIGSPLALTDSTFARRCWTKYTAIPALEHPAVNVLQGTVTRIDAQNKRAWFVRGEGTQEWELAYDFLVASTGMRRTWPVVPQRKRREEYLSEVEGHLAMLKELGRADGGGVVVVGGGAVGIEMAAEISVHFPSIKTTLIHSRAELLSSEPLPQEFKTTTLRRLRETGVNIILSHRVIDVKDENDGTRTVFLSDESSIRAGMVVWALSHQVPSTTYLPPAAVFEDGLVKVTSTLNLTEAMPNSKSHFAAGDNIKWSGIRRCGPAMSMGHVCALNIYEHLLIEEANEDGRQHVPNFVEMRQVRPAIGLAVGRYAVLYNEVQGVRSGEEQKKLLFGDDLGWKKCWDFLRLAERHPLSL